MSIIRRLIEEWKVGRHVVDVMNYIFEVDVSAELRVAATPVRGISAPTRHLPAAPHAFLPGQQRHSTPAFNTKLN
jgi:hypothetical protein